MQKNYFNTINTYEFLTPETEMELAKKMRQGNKAARDHLIHSHMRMVLPIARKFKKHNIPLEDLIQEGNLGLITAVDKFDYTKNARLATYARAWINEFIKRKVYKEHYSTELPVKYVRKILQEANPEELKKLEALRKPFYINNEVNTEEDSGAAHITKNIADERETPDQRFERKSIRSLLNRKISYSLAADEAEVIEKRFLKRKMTYKQIGQQMQVSLETIRNKEKKALSKLKYAFKDERESWAE